MPAYNVVQNSVKEHSGEEVSLHKLSLHAHTTEGWDTLCPTEPVKRIIELLAFS